MKIILSVIFLALSLLHGVQGEAQCIKSDDLEDSFCGCELQDESGDLITEIELDFVGIRYGHVFIDDCDVLPLGRHMM